MLTDSNECLTRVVNLVYKSVVLYVDDCTDVNYFFSSIENLCDRGGGRKLMHIEVFSHSLS